MTQNSSTFAINIMSTEHKNICVGIIDQAYKYEPSINNSFCNLIYYSGQGQVWNMKYQEVGRQLEQGELIIVKVNFEKATVEWTIRSKVVFTVKN